MLSVRHLDPKDVAMLSSFDRCVSFVAAIAVSATLLLASAPPLPPVMAALA